MEFYIVVENGEAYPHAYKRYAAAVAAVKEKHKETIQDQINEIGMLEEIETILANINVPESDRSHLYIEKGINIIIQKLYIK